MIPTPHINCSDKELIAKTVLMPGDPLRAKFLADTFLTDVTMFNSVRNIFGYTGYYKGRRISVMASGMGMPSIGIYSYELFKFYDVEQIIRIGSAGAYSERLNVYDVVLATSAYSESTFPFVQSGIKDKELKATESLNEKIKLIANKLSINLKEAKIHSSDVFYHEDELYWQKMKNDFGCEAVEMESVALFANAISCNKKAACLLTISDSFITHEVTTSKERESSFTKMMEIALELAE